MPRQGEPFVPKWERISADVWVLMSPEGGRELGRTWRDGGPQWFWKTAGERDLMTGDFLLDEEGEIICMTGTAAPLGRAQRQLLLAARQEQGLSPFVGSGPEKGGAVERYVASPADDAEE